MTAPDRFAFRYLDPDGAHEASPDCKTWACAVLSLSPISRRLVDALLINGEPHLFPVPVPAMDYFLQNQRIARGVVAAIEEYAASALAQIDDTRLLATLNAYHGKLFPELSWFAGMRERRMREALAVFVQDCSS